MSRRVSADEILRDMERRGLIERSGEDRYVLTPAGWALAWRYRHVAEEAA